MNISLDWLSDFLPGRTDAPRAADALMRGGFPVESIKTHGDDTVLDVEVTSNRSDCLSHVGIGRELAAMQRREFRVPLVNVATAPANVSGVTSVAIEAAELCPYYSARVIRNVKIGPSPDWMIRRLEAIGLRAINNVVDVTNYVMFELGQPLHAFDLDKLRGGRIIVRRARAGEKIVSIDGHERALAPEMLVIADAERAVAVAGVMGGRDTEVLDTTVNVLLESARFDPLSVRRTARALAMKSDSSYRFERGIDPTLADRASLRAAQLIVESGGGELLAGVASAGSDEQPPKTLTLRLGQLKRILGIDVPAKEAVDALSRLQLSPVQNGETIAVRAPSWRLDLNIEADLIEEVARVIGYDRIPIRDEISIRLTPPEPSAHSIDAIRSTLVGAGYFEAVTFTFVADNLAGDFLSPDARALPRADEAVRKADARLRPSLLPGLLEAVRRNETMGTAGAQLFEIGATFSVDAASKVQERRRLGLVGASDYHAVRGTVEALLRKLNKERAFKVVPEDRSGYARGAAGRIEWDSQTIGHIGKIDARIAEKLALREIPVAAELDLDAMIEGTQHVPQLHSLARFPAVRRDLSLVVSEQMPYAALESLIARQNLRDLEQVEYVTTYRGKPLEKQTKSVTVALVFRSANSTLTSEQVEAAVEQVVAAAGKELSATLRA